MGDAFAHTRHPGESRDLMRLQVLLSPEIPAFAGMTKGA
jgi:hypothetical protein